MSSEEQLVAAIYLLYFYSCFAFLPKEYAALEVFGRKTKIIFPLDGFSLHGKALFFFNPFFFFRPVFPADLNHGDTYRDRKFKKSVRAVGAVLKRFIPAVAMLWGVMLVILPLSLFAAHHNLMLASMLVMYLCILLLLVQLWFARKKLAMDNRKFLSLTAEYILCPPFALNAIRSIPLSMHIKQGHS